LKHPPPDRPNAIQLNLRHQHECRRRRPRR
jgi:hypothetical protein